MMTGQAWPIQKFCHSFAILFTISLSTFDSVLRIRTYQESALPSIGVAKILSGGVHFLPKKLTTFF